MAGLDPGKEKCGVALLDETGQVIDRGVISREVVLSQIRDWLNKYKPLTVVIGDRTGSKRILEELKAQPWARQLQDVAVVDEHMTTMEARRRYFADNPRRGWRRLIPETMQLPPVPYDDYVAIILAERYLSRFAL